MSSGFGQRPFQFLHFLLLTDAKALEQKGRLGPGPVEFDHIHADCQLVYGDSEAIRVAEVGHAEVPAKTIMQDEAQPHQISQKPAGAYPNKKLST